MCSAAWATQQEPRAPCPTQLGPWRKTLGQPRLRSFLAPLEAVPVFPALGEKRWDSLVSARSSLRLRQSRFFAARTEPRPPIHPANPRQRLSDAVKEMGPAGTRRTWLAFAQVVVSLLVFVAVVLQSIHGYHLRIGQDAHLAGGAAAPALYEQVSRWSTHYFEAQHMLSIYCDDVGEIDRGIHALEEARNGLDTGAVHFELGALQYRAGHLAEAEESMEACLARWPFSRESYRLLLRMRAVEERPAVYARAKDWLTESDLEAIAREMPPPP